MNPNSQPPSPFPSWPEDRALSGHLVGAVGGSVLPLSEIEERAFVNVEEEWESDVDHELSQSPLGWVGATKRSLTGENLLSKSSPKEMSAALRNPPTGMSAVSSSCPREKPLATKNFPAGKNGWRRAVPRRSSSPALSDWEDSVGQELSEEEASIGQELSQGSGSRPSVQASGEDDSDKELAQDNWEHGRAHSTGVKPLLWEKDVGQTELLRAQ